MPDSMFGRLFRYARSPELDPLENFTTEALAACIRADPVPMLRLLAAHFVVSDPEAVTEVVAMTQVSYAGAGIIDLVLQLRSGDRIEEVWVEVKVAAGESGQQLDNYRAWIAAQPDAVRPRLVTLARSPIRADPDLIWLPWQSVRHQALAVDSPYWRDLAAFLEDIHMADEFDAPITSREAGSLADANRLRGKTIRILWKFMQEAAVSWPAVPWPTTEGDLRDRVDEWHRRRGRYAPEIWGHSRTGGWLSLGVWPAEGEARLGVSIVTDPKFIASRKVLLSLADAGCLPPTWSRLMAGWEGLVIRTGLAGSPDHDAARGWLRERMVELDAAGLLRALPELSTA